MSYQAQYRAVLRRYQRQVRRCRYRRSFSPREMAVAAGLGLVVAAGTAGVAVKTHGHHNPPGAALLAKAAVSYAHHQLGKPYIWGGTGPAGYDCSGLTLMAWQHAGITIPRTSQEQWAGLHHVAKPKPGDLVFSYWPDPADPVSPNHVQIYAGSGWVIGADTTDVERVRLSTDAGHIVGYANPAAGEAASANRALGLRMATAAGLNAQQRHCLDLLWTRESGWQARVWNSAGSGAYGIPQALPASKMAAAGADWRTNPATQIRWGLGYIKGRYTTPCSAWAHETTDGWY